MRTQSLAASIVAIGLISVAQCQLLPFFKSPAARIPEGNFPAIQAQNQHPMEASPGIQLPPGSQPEGSNPSDSSPAQKNSVRISDVIGHQHNIGIFAGFTRDIESVAKRLDSASTNTTLLAPLNSVMSALPRKPWEDPQEYAAMGASAYEGSDGQSRAHANLRRFTEAHVVEKSPWQEGEKATTLLGATVWWESKDGKTMIQPGNVEVDKIVSRVANGEIWILKGVMNYSR